MEASEDKTLVRLEDVVSDKLWVRHEIRSTPHEVRFAITTHNPTGRRSETHRAQPCIRLAKFTGADQQGYFAKSCVFLDDKLARMPMRDWATLGGL